MAQLKVTQVRSLIGRTERQKATVKSLGLRKINHSVVVNPTPQMVGMLRAVSHLIKIEEV